MFLITREHYDTYKSILERTREFKRLQSLYLLARPDFKLPKEWSSFRKKDVDSNHQGLKDLVIEASGQTIALLLTAMDQVNSIERLAFWSTDPTPIGREIVDLAKNLYL